MPTINCPFCNQTYEVEPNVIGQKVRCAVCNEPFIALEPEAPIPLDATPVIVETQPTSQKLYSQTYIQNSYGAEPKTVHVHQNVYIQQPQQTPVASSATKSRTVYIVLAILFGNVGFHDFYAGYIMRGVIHLGICLLFGATEETLAAAIFISYVWAFVEIFTIKNDVKGIPMQ